MYKFQTIFSERIMIIRYSRACGSYQDFLDRGLVLTRKLLNQWFLLVKLKSSLRKISDRHHDWFTVMEYLCHKWLRICSTCRKHFPFLSEHTWWRLFWAYLMKVILSIPDAGYSEHTWWRLFWAYLMKVILSIPDEGYSRNAPHN